MEIENIESPDFVQTADEAFAHADVFIVDKHVFAFEAIQGIARTQGQRQSAAAAATGKQVMVPVEAVVVCLQSGSQVSIVPENETVDEVRERWVRYRMSRRTH